MRRERRETNSKNIEIYINKGLKFLFTGTPCLVLVAKEYLNKRNIRTDNLVLCDIICHGTPNPIMFSKYLELCEKKGKK